MSEKWVITGANGNLGRKLVTELADGGVEVVAVVRSQRAADTVRAEIEGADHVAVRILSYTDVAALAEACDGADHVVHLVGIIKEGGGATYHDAHEASSTALVAALRSQPDIHITYLSIVDSHPESTNRCLASKGRAEAIMRDAANPVCVLRVPMVLGEDDYVSVGLRKRVLAGKATGFRMASLEQPIYAGDVTAAIRAAAAQRVDADLDLGGPEVVTRAELSRRAGAVFDREVQIRSLPIGLGRLLAAILGRLLKNPPITPPMLDILDHDDQIDNRPALEALRMSSLTSLDDMLRKTISCPELS